MPDLTSGLFLRFVGRLRDDGTFTLDRGWETPRITEPVTGTPGYRLELVDREGERILWAPVRVDDGECRSAGGHMRSSRVVAYLPLRPEGAGVRFGNDDYVFYERTFAPDRPEVGWLDASVSGDSLRLRWHARHPENVTFDVAIVQERRICRMLMDSSELEAAIDLPRIPLQGRCHAVVLATDGLRSATAASEPFVLPPKAPRITIISPEPDQVFSEDEGFSCIGHAMAPEGHSLDDESLQWHVDGVALARGTRITFCGALGVGSHLVELTWRDARDGVRIMVRDRTEDERAWKKIVTAPFRQ